MLVDGTGNGKSLLCPPDTFVPPLGNGRIFLPIHFFHKFFCLSNFHCLLQAFFICHITRITVGNIRSDCTGEQNCFLRSVADLVAQRLLRIVFDISSIDQYFTASGIIEARNQD